MNSKRKSREPRYSNVSPSEVVAINAVISGDAARIIAMYDKLRPTQRELSIAAAGEHGGQDEAVQLELFDYVAPETEKGHTK